MEPARVAFLRMQAALREAMGRLAHADAQRRRFFADLAHELATPTSTLLGLAETLARPELTPTPEARARLLAGFERETARLERLVADIRDLANLEDPDVRVHRTPTDVGALAAAIVEHVRALPSDAPRARIDVDAPAAIAPIDATRVEQVLVNLLTNALRYTPADRAVHVRVEDRGARVRIEVEDEGPGVPDDVLPRLGERLYRADPSRDRRTGGHGLGLAIVHAIAHKHGGAVAFERGVAGGLRAVVELPAATAPA
jgi:signal transduction histidine kinase